MKEKIMARGNIGEFFLALKDEYDIYAPVRSSGNHVNFKKVSSADEMTLDYLNTTIPPKEIWFPRVETLFEYEIHGQDIKVMPPRVSNERETIIIGIRPCDAASFRLLRKFFDYGTFKDDLFKKHEEKIALIGLKCNEPKKTCFCTSVNGSPHKKEDFDVALTDIADKFVVEAITKKGENILQKLSFLKDASGADLEKAKQSAIKAEQAITAKFDVNKAANIVNDNFYNALWEEISTTCLGCGSCSFLCPTCHCFDVVDENDYANHRGRRIRTWDTCQSTLFTLHTSGHNPRPSQKERCRQRIAHKFCYYPNNYGVIGCVGCGRCIIDCPVNNDVRDIIQKINKIKTTQ
nr:4Fe-4S dicluster domain-containing protein [Candidatus Sigynarchaeum springense]MDO8116217.1 4Fe-4S dicluster domain-containing protein [Candidatus Sigynarchaeota archaeon]